MHSATEKEKSDYGRIRRVMDSHFKGPIDKDYNSRVWNDSTISRVAWCDAVRYAHRNYEMHHKNRNRLENMLANESAGLEKDVAPVLADVKSMHTGETWLRNAMIEELKQEIEDAVDACNEFSSQCHDLADDIGEAKMELKNREEARSKMQRGE